MNKSLIHLALGAAVFSTACAPIRIEQQSSIPVPERFEQAAPARPVADRRTPAPADTAGEATASPDLSQWWTSWQDPVLSQLIDEALAASPELKAVDAQRQAARAMAALADADRGPFVGAGGIAGLMSQTDNPLPDQLRPALSAAGVPLAGQASFNRPNARAVGFVASWEPDIFGQKRSDADAAHQAALGETEKWHGAQLLLVSEVADHYVQARTLQRRIEQGEERVATLVRLQQYVEARFRAGHVTAYERDEVKANLSVLRAQLSTLAAQADAHVRALAVLTGRSPQGYRLPESPRDLLSNTPAAPAGLQPLDVLNRRPDVRASERAVKAYSARLASARADRLPRFDIRFLWQSGRIELDSDLPAMRGNTGLVSAGVTVPLFTAGRIRQNIAAADARLKAALARYDQSLLTALAEVDNRYQLQHSLNRQNELLAEAEARSLHQAETAERLFRYGELTLDRALRARLQAQQLGEQKTLGQQAEVQNLLNLYKALGGGWRTGEGLL